MKKIKIAVIGAAGYAGEELLRLLLNHPNAEIKIITSRKYADQPIGTIFPRFTESELKFTKPNVDEIIKECDVAFLALPHGLAAEYARPLQKGGVTIIDISADFRLRDLDKYKKYYKVDHPAPELMEKTVYGSPELYREEIKTAEVVACPGCYVTSVILPGTALLRKNLVETENNIASCMSGVTGAGRKVDLPFIFPEVNESLRAYGVTGHRHLPEMEQELTVASGTEEVKINFTPHLVPVNRGINSTLFFDLKDGVTKEDVIAAFKEAYDNEPFVRVLDYGKMPDTKNVTRTNFCEIGFQIDDHTGKLIVVSCIDNLTKGASGQAVQNLNIRFGLKETTGLL
jgi:N-acetyl-gamma-glutamyl-phosphate reductase